MADLNANDIDQAMKIIEGSARSMGLDVVEGWENGEANKKTKQLSELNNEKFYSVDEAIATLREHKAKFDETVEVARTLALIHADQMVRGMVSLPSGTGKEVKVAVFAKGENADKASGWRR